MLRVQLINYNKPDEIFENELHLPTVPHPGDFINVRHGENVTAYFASSNRIMYAEPALNEKNQLYNVVVIPVTKQEVRRIPIA